MHVLLIEDYPEMAVAISRILELRGHDTTWAASGKAGLLKLANEGFDLILCDLWLTDTDGYSLMERIRLRTDVPAIAMSVERRHLNVQRGLAVGFDGFMEKPFDVDQFLKFIDRFRVRRAAKHPPILVLSDSEPV